MPRRAVLHRNNNIYDFIGHKCGIENHLEVVGVEEKKTKCNRYYFVRCNVCSLDPELYGNAIFKATKINLLAGNIPCGCGRTVRWTREQYSVKVIRNASTRGYSFNGFIEPYKGDRTRAIFKCNKCENSFDCTINNFLRDRGCPRCASSGFKKDKPATVYVLKVEGSTQFVGYGITNNFRRRLTTHKTNLKRVGAYVTDYRTYSTSGVLAKDLETKVKYNFLLFENTVPGFKTEAVNYRNYENVLSLIEEFLKEKE